MITQGGSRRNPRDTLTYGCDRMNEIDNATPFTLSIPTLGTEALSVTLQPGEVLFVVGANGKGKSSLMHRLYRDNFETAVRITAHRRTWLSSSVVDMTARQKQQNELDMRNQERALQYRWLVRLRAIKQHAGMTVFNLIDAENSTARKIGCHG